MRWIVLFTLLAACAREVPSVRAEASDDEVVGAIFDEAAPHHLEQHPDADCRVDWRPKTLAVHAATVAPTIDRLVHTAKRFLGVAYHYGHTGEDGFDCSAFVNRVFAEHGYDLPRTARELARVGLRLGADALAAGDLVFFANGGRSIDHVGVALGDGTFIHASSSRGVVIDHLSAAYYRAHFVMGRRVVALPPGRYSRNDGSARSDVAFDDAEALETYAAAHPTPCEEETYARAQ